MLDSKYNFEMELSLLTKRNSLCLGRSRVPCKHRQPSPKLYWSQAISLPGLPMFTRYPRSTVTSYFNALTSMILCVDFKQPIRWRSFLYDTNMEYRAAKRCNCFAKQYPGNAKQKFSEPGMILLAKPSKKNLISASPLSSMTMA